MLFSIVEIATNGHQRRLNILLKLKEFPENELKDSLLGSVKNDKVKCVEILFNREVDVETVDNQNNTPLILSCRRGCVSVVQLLLARGANVGQVNNDGETALHAAASAGQVECVQLLLVQSPEVNVQDLKYQRTPLMVACLDAPQPDEIIHSLITACCDVNIRDSDGKTAVHHASERGLNLTQLFKGGADLNVVDNGWRHGSSYSGFLWFTRSCE